MFTITIVAGFGAAYLQITSAAASRQSHEADAMRSFYLAEAGLAEAFQAVRIGRTGQIGAEEAPALFGDGLLWVNATDTADDQVRLEATAIVGRGRSTLAYVVEPKELALGFFSVEDLVIDSVILVDGYDSKQNTYEGAVEDTKNLLSSLAQDTKETSVELAALDKQLAITTSELEGAHSEWSGLLALEDDYESSSLKELESVHDSRIAEMEGSIETYQTQIHNLRQENLASGEDSLASQVNLPVQSLVELQDSAITGSLSHTLGDGLLSSNGNVIFNTPTGEESIVFGDIRYGPNADLEEITAVQLSGSAEPLPNEIDFPAVEIPSVPLSTPIRHEGLLPMEVPTGTSGYESIVVAADSDLTLTGPAIIVIGSLTLEDGALMTLDTRAGNVELYITGELKLQTGSMVSALTADPSGVAIQVDAVPSLGEAPIQLDASGSFYGTIYAPETEVDVGSHAEIFGGIIARKLNIAQGARLHFDNSGMEGSPIPRIVSWQVVEMPEAVRTPIRNPFSRLGVNRSDLSEIADAHDLDHVQLDLTYITKGGITQSFSGLEKDFAWDAVATVVSVDRDPTRVSEGGTKNPEPTGVEEEEPVSEGPDAGTIRTSIADVIVAEKGKTLRDSLIAAGPLSTAELVHFLEDDQMSDEHASQVLMASTPLSNAVLDEVLNGPGQLKTEHLANVLVAMSPLSPEALDRVLNIPDSQLSGTQRERVLNANK